MPYERAGDREERFVPAAEQKGWRFKPRPGYSQDKADYR